jgi:hypothetical protein
MEKRKRPTLPLRRAFVLPRQLGGEGCGSRSGESAGELRDDRQVSMKLNPIKPTDAKR